MIDPSLYPQAAALFREALALNHLEKPAPDPVIAEQRHRYSMNRAQRRAYDRLKATR